MWHLKNVLIPVVVGTLGTVKRVIVENIKEISEAAIVTEIQKISMHGLAPARLIHKKNTRKDCDTSE